VRLYERFPVTFNANSPGTGLSKVDSSEIINRDLEEYLNKTETIKKTTIDKLAYEKG